MEKKKIILKFFGVLFIFIFIFLPGYSKFQELSQKNRSLEEKVRQIELSNQRLTEEIKRLENDPVYVEKIARDKLKVTKKDEIVYKMVEEPENNVAIKKQ
jgi:cell division protein DivIC